MIFLRFIVLLSIYWHSCPLEASGRIKDFLSCNQIFSKGIERFPILQKNKISSKHLVGQELFAVFNERIRPTILKKVGEYKEVRWIGEGESGIVFVLILESGENFVVKYYLDRRNLSKDLRRFDFAKKIFEVFNLPIRVPETLRVSKKILFIPFISSMTYREAVLEEGHLESSTRIRNQLLFDDLYELLTDAYRESGSLELITNADFRTSFQTPKGGRIKLHIHRGNLLIDGESFWLIDPY